MKIKNEILLKKIKSILHNKLKLDIDKIILFGSRINGNATDDSDYDILIILNQNYNWIDETRIIDETYEISLEHNILLDIKVISVNELNSLRGKQAFVQLAIKNGLSL